jgi:hypothetical protein
MRWFDRVTFQEPTEIRLPSGAVEYEWANVPELTDLPARITAETEERRDDRQVTTEDRFNILVSGERVITTEMAVLSGDAVYDVLRVLPWALGRRARRTTLIIAERVAL